MADVVDPYQARYIAHQARKRDTLLRIMRERHSDRMYDARPVGEELRERVREVITLCPSSCDRRGVAVREVDSRDERELLSGLLVGGVGWLHRAPWILLVFADPLAYKAGGEIAWMPYLDAGVIIQQVIPSSAPMGKSKPKKVAGQHTPGAGTRGPAKPFVSSATVLRLPTPTPPTSGFAGASATRTPTDPGGSAPFRWPTP
ncbi:hypothetical protein [Nonomuraea sp. NPDC052265]|uniref:hypothetical protein n=1 Tax=Nonomuraea sp. NPDC052265 TaxID=3364374 RepID=UPI0037CC81A1